MNKWWWVCVGFSASAVMAATEFKGVEPSLQKALGGLGMKSAQFDAGVLRLETAKPDLTELQYMTLVYHDVCAHQWRTPQQFAQWKLERVEVRTADASKAYAFDARGDICAQMGMMGVNYRQLIQQRTTSCAQAGCTPARP